jgi:hypothetical protein
MVDHRSMLMDTDDYPLKRVAHRIKYLFGIHYFSGVYSDGMPSSERSAVGCF